MKIGYKCEVVDINEVVLNLSEKCNNLCLSCPNDDNFRKDIIEPEKVLEFIQENVSKDTDRVTFIGGEPTIMKNLLRLISYVKKITPNATIQINSNGRMFSYLEFTRKFTRYWNLEIHIALYASTPKIHDDITQIPGSFEQTVKGIRNLLGLGFPVDVRTIVSNKNYKDLPDFAGFVVNELKSKGNRIKRVTIVGMDIIGNALKNKDRLIVSHLETAPYIEKCVDILKEEDYSVEIHLLPKGIFKKRYHQYASKSGCVGGNFVDALGCKECSYKDECCHLLKSYVDYFGIKEHEPIYR